MIAADPTIHSSLNRHDGGLPREGKDLLRRLPREAEGLLRGKPFLRNPVFASRWSGNGYSRTAGRATSRTLYIPSHKRVTH
jgi:hypothetical protein